MCVGWVTSLILIPVVFGAAAASEGRRIEKQAGHPHPLLDGFSLALSRLPFSSDKLKWYTVAIPFVHLGWVGLDFECSTILLGQ